MIVRRGEIFFAELNPVQGSEQGGTRPVLVVQNDIGNQYSPTTIVVAITSQINKAKLPTHVELPKEKTGLDKDSVILAEQVAVHTINLFLSNRNGNPPGFRIINGIFPGADVPFPPRSNNFQIRSQGFYGQFKTHLVITFSGSTMGDGLRPFFPGNLH
jgi:mRNA-degrading endonuclease toxin of MazEF toxin-antitoxin module